MMNKCTVLYAGGFKPITGAHVDIIKRYLAHPNVHRVVLFISPSKREEIDADTAYEITKRLLEKNDRVEIVLDKTSYSPLLSIYRWIEDERREPGQYALASSAKGKDYQRVKEFVKNYTEKEYKHNLPEGVEVIELPLDVSPMLYKDGTPISASSVREAIRNGDYDVFEKAYPNLPKSVPKYIWKRLNPKKEDIEESGELTGVGGSGYQRNYPSQIYKSIKNVYEWEEQQDT